MLCLPYCGRLLGAVVIASQLVSTSAGPMEYEPRHDRNQHIDRQVAPTTNAITSLDAVTASSAQITTPQTRSITASRSLESRTAVSPSNTILITSSAAATSLSQAPITSRHVSIVSSSSTSSHSSVASSSSTTSSASATATSSPSNNIFSESSKYFPYTIAVIVVVSVFGLLLLVLFIRFLVQCFSRKPEPTPAPINTNLGAGAWRYSQDSDLESTGALPISPEPTRTNLGPRHKDSGTEMGERQAFLSTESVALYPVVNKSSHEYTRYTDEEPQYLRHTRSLSSSTKSGSQPTTPFVSRRPGSMSFLHSHPTTHPTFVLHPGSETDHSGDSPPDMRAVPEKPAPVPNATSTLLLARAGHSDAYRQQTLASGVTDLSRATSTASAYSQPSMRSAPPLPELPAQYARPSQGQLSPDVSAALSTLQSHNESTDTVQTIRSTAPPTEEDHHVVNIRQVPGRTGWNGKAPSSIHGPNLYFGHSQ